MALKAIYDKVDDIPEPHRELYTETDGKFKLTGVEGVRFQEDVDRLNQGILKERNETKKYKEKAAAWGDLDPTDVLAKLDKYPELEAAAAGKLDDEKINGIVEGRVRSKLGPIERENKTLKEQLGQMSGVVEQFQTKERSRTIGDSVREAASKSKVIDSALEDIQLLGERVFEIDENGKVVTKDGVGVTPGVAPDVWLTEMQQKRPHWWPPSQGGGAGGSGRGGLGGGANNPYSYDHWDLTAQGQLYRTSPEKAEQMAKAAGHKAALGATRPPKPQGK